MTQITDRLPAGHPLLTSSPLPLELPDFAAVSDAELAAALRHGMAEQRAEVEEIWDGELVLVTTRDLAVMAATLATGGRQPITGERVEHALPVIGGGAIHLRVAFQPVGIWPA